MLILSQPQISFSPLGSSLPCYLHSAPDALQDQKGFLLQGTWADENDQYSGIFFSVNLWIFVPFMNVQIV
jgi:hypothetical protein